MFVNEWYSQCQPGVASSTVGPTGGQTTGGQTTGRPTTGKFPACQFRVGRSYDQVINLLFLSFFCLKTNDLKIFV